VDLNKSFKQHRIDVSARNKMLIFQHLKLQRNINVFCGSHFLLCFAAVATQTQHQIFKRELSILATLLVKSTV